MGVSRRVLEKDKGVKLLMSIAILFHSNCFDGHTAAWVARKHFSEQGINPDFFPCSYGKEGSAHGVPWQEIADGKYSHIYILDFCLSREELIAIAERAPILSKEALAAFANNQPLPKPHKNHAVWNEAVASKPGDTVSLTVLDHHKSHQDACDGLPFCTFDMERSGAGLSWDHFYPDTPRPWIVDYVEDRDVWRHALMHSKTVNAYIMCQDRTWENWDRMLGMNLQDAIDQGRGAEAYLNRYVRDMCKLARKVNFPVRPNNPDAGFFTNIPVVNAPYIGTSELVGKLAESALFAVGWHQTASGMYYYSLRARGGFDVAELAKNFGGGGHAGAAGFLVSTRVHE